jgi:hypothetical protein
MIGLERKSLFYGCIHDAVETGFIGVAKLFVEGADDMLRALDQVIVVQDQVSGRRMRIQVLKRITIPVLGQIHDLIQVEIFFLRLGKAAAGVVDP